jgi:hypothetical protein
MKRQNSVKLNILKRILGRKMVVITDHIKNEYYYGSVESVIDEGNVNIKSLSGENKKVSIFDLRSPSVEYP